MGSLAGRPMEPSDYLRALQRRWALVAAAALVTATAFWLTAPAHGDTSPITTYSASHTLLVDRGSPSRSGAQTNVRVLDVLATSGDIPLRVARRLGLPDSPQALAARVEVEADPKIDALHISSTGADPDAVAALVDAFADEILRLAEERNEIQRTEAFARAKAAAQAQQTRIQDLEARIAQLPVGSSEVRIATAERDALLNVYARQQATLQALASEPAGPGLLSLGPALPLPTTAADPSAMPALRLPADRGSRLFLGAVLGLLLGCGLALVIDRIDSRVHDRRGAERVFGLPVVAEIPRGRVAMARPSGLNPSPLLTSSDPEIVEAYRRLAVAVLHTPRWVLAPRPPGDEEDRGVADARLVQGPSRLVVVTSAAREEVRAAIVAHLAAALATIGREVIAIEADYERPRLAEYLGARADGTDESPSVGIPRLLATTVPGVRVVPRAGLVGGQLTADRGLIDRYLGLADVILVNCPQIVSGGVAAVWAVEADAVLLVSSGATTADAASFTREHLARLQAQVLGVAFVANERYRVPFLRRRRRPNLPAPRHAPNVRRTPVSEGPAPRPQPTDAPRERSAAVTGPSRDGEVPAPATTGSTSRFAAKAQAPAQTGQRKPWRTPPPSTPPQTSTARPEPSGSAPPAPSETPTDARADRSTTLQTRDEPTPDPPPVEPEIIPEVQVLAPPTPRRSANGPAPRRPVDPLASARLEHWPTDRTKE